MYWAWGALHASYVSCYNRDFFIAVPSAFHSSPCAFHLRRLAAEALLVAALKNPRNQKFFMLSESDLPLYSPHVTYLQARGNGHGAGDVSAPRRCHQPVLPAACCKTPWLPQLRLAAPACARWYAALFCCHNRGLLACLPARS